MDSSDDEEERLRRWKEHLAAQQTDDEEEGPPPAELLSARRGESSSGRATSAARRRAEQEQAISHRPAAPHDSLDVAARGGGGEIDWRSAMMPQLKQLQHERDSLQAKLKEQERIISRLNQQNQDLNQSFEDGPPTDQKEHKIVELAKKNRALTLALDKERAKVGRMTTDVKRLQQELETANRGREAFAGMDARCLPKEPKGTREVKPGGALAFGRAIVSNTDSIPENEQTPEDKVRELTSKLTALNGQVNTQRLANERLKQENGKVKEVLKRELGDVPVDTALRGIDGGGGGWTGRAQTISLLQSKVVELKRELAVALEAKLSPAGSPNGKSAATAGSGLSSPSKAALHLDGASRVDAQHRREIDKIDRDRRQEAAALQEQVDKERADRAVMKRKLDAASSRVSVLEKETKDLRDKLEVVLSKTDNDDALIAALQAEMAAMARSAKENKRCKKEELKQDDAASAEHLHEKDAQIERQHKIILSLRAELQAAVMRGKDASARADRAAGKEAAESEMDKTRLSAAQHEVRMLQVENSKLGELTEMLKRKLAQAEEHEDSTSAALRQEKHRSVELERQLASAQEGARPGGSARSGSASRRGSSAANFAPEKVQQLVDRLNSTTEEMEALQESFQRTLAVKEHELRSAREMLRDQRAVFEEAQHDLESKLASLHHMIQDVVR